MSSTVAQPPLSENPSVIGRLVSALSKLAARALDRSRVRRDERGAADAEVIPGA